MTGESDAESVGSASEGTEIVPPGLFVVVSVVGRPFNDAFASLEALESKEVFESRESVVQIVPLFFPGAFSSSLRLAMQQIISGRAGRHPAVVSAVWKCGVVASTSSIPAQKGSVCAERAIA